MPSCLDHERRRRRRRAARSPGRRSTTPPLAESILKPGVERGDRAWRARPRGSASPTGSGRRPARWSPATYAALQQLGVEPHETRCSTRCATASGRTNVVYTAGMPADQAPVGMPHALVVLDLGRGRGDACVGGGRCWIGCGMVVDRRDVLVDDVTSPPVPCTRSASGSPPVGGGLFVYHQRSIVFTMPLPPWSRTHSTVRTPSESVPGRWSACT